MKVRLDSKLLAAAAVGSMLCIAFPYVARSQEASANAAKTNSDTAEASKPTPRLADGHPSLSGVWNPWAGHVSQGDTSKTYGKTLEDGSVYVTYAGKNQPPGQPRAQGGRPRAVPPPYKPEFLAKVKDLADHQTMVDPYFTCNPPGVPRIGPPHEIVQDDREVAFIYSDTNGNYWRIVPTDGRPHNKEADASYLGDSIGHWDGDTLVIDVNNFNDDTWFGNSGYFHSTALHVTERLTRQGDTLLYQVTVEDPNVLTGPWVLPDRTQKISNERLEEAPPCRENDRPHFTDLSHH